MQGFVLKPVQGPPKGKREIEFYQHISSSPHPVDLQFYNLVPKVPSVLSEEAWNVKIIVTIKRCDFVLCWAVEQ